MSKDNGGPAFPSQTEMRDGTFSTEPGMTLRDYFAAKAMQACFSALIADNKAQYAEDAGKIAKVSYSLSDAMLEERNK